MIVRFARAWGPEVGAAARVLSAALDSRRPRVIVEHVVGMTTVTATYDPLEHPYDDVVDELKAIVAETNATIRDVRPREIEVPVCYGREFGPDLEFVSEHAGIAVDAVIDLHTSRTYVVEMIGFMPGFPYLGGLDERIAVPRRDSPRPRVAAGSVGIAGMQTGIYPNVSPGGWQIIGRTPQRLFDPSRDEPGLLSAGDAVRFLSISPERFETLG